MPELKEGTLLAGRYALVRRLGSGGMAEVWLADDRRFESRVALKFPIDPESFRARKQLQKEWRVGSRLMHANIIRVFEFHEDGNAVFHSMQYISGPDISVLCRANLEEILGPIGLLADALRYAHAKNLIHRDIKARNVLLDSHGVPYLIDFGVAAASGEAMVGGGSRIASSPEQRAGAEAACSDDIFSLGVLMVELITGSPPNVADEFDIASVTDHAGDPLPTSLRVLISEMLDTNPANRPVAEELQQRLRDAGFPARPAPTRLLGSASPDIEALSVESIRPAEKKVPSGSQAIPAHVASTEVTTKVLYGGLAVLSLVVVGVIFFLPSWVEDNERESTTLVPDSQTDSAVSRDLQGDDRNAERLDDQNAANRADFDERDRVERGDRAALTKAATDESLGDLLSQLERLEFRAIERWGGQPYLDMLQVYEQGDRAYVDRDYALAGELYRKSIVLLEPFFAQVDAEFDKALQSARDAFDNGDHINAVVFYDLAVAITPGNVAAEAGLDRARSLKKVLDLTDQALQFEGNLELDAARIAFEQILELDALWEPAIIGLKRIRASIRQFSFDQRMTEGLNALAFGDYATSRAAFNAAKLLYPDSRQPADGLLQVDQEIRLAGISRLEQEAMSLEENEEWETAIGVYEEALAIDPDLQFAQEGLRRSKQRAELHSTLNGYINDPDSLSAPITMQNATNLFLSLSRITPVGPRLEDQKNTLSRLLKRAATPIDVLLVSDSQTDVAIFRVAKLGAFQSRELNLRPGVYIAVGSRPGYRDVRIEFRVAPEIEMKPIVVRCEEQI